MWHVKVDYFHLISLFIISLLCDSIKFTHSLFKTVTDFRIVFWHAVYLTSFNIYIYMDVPGRQSRNQECVF